jgi:hypothetical protein
LLLDESQNAKQRRARLTELFEAVVAGNTLASELAAEIPKEVMQAEAWSIALPFLDWTDSRPFRELAWLFRDLDLPRCLEKLLQLAELREDDVDFREVIEDFS